MMNLHDIYKKKGRLSGKKVQKGNDRDRGLENYYSSDASLVLYSRPPLDSVITIDFLLQVFSLHFMVHSFCV